MEKREPKFFVNYAHLGLKGDIPNFTFDNHIECNIFIDQYHNELYDVRDEKIDGVVYLFAYNFIDHNDPDSSEESFDNEILVTESFDIIQEYVDDITCDAITTFELDKEKDEMDVSMAYDAHFFIFEFESYEGAYEVALSMREGNPLCYDKEEVNPNLN